MKNEGLWKISVQKRTRNGGQKKEEQLLSSCDVWVGNQSSDWTPLSSQWCFSVCVCMCVCVFINNYKGDDVLSEPGILCCGRCCAASLFFQQNDDCGLPLTDTSTHSQVHLIEGLAMMLVSMETAIT